MVLGAVWDRRRRCDIIVGSYFGVAVRTIKVKIKATRK
jgi:hypothetical protein